MLDAGFCNVKVSVTTMKSKFEIQGRHLDALKKACQYVYTSTAGIPKFKILEIELLKASGVEFEFVLHNIIKNSFLEDSIYVMEELDKAMLAFGGFNPGGTHHFFGVKIASYSLIEQQ